MKFFLLLLQAALKCKYEEQFETIKKIISVEQRESNNILRRTTLTYFLRVQRNKNKIEELECCMNCNKRIPQDVKLLKTLSNARTTLLSDDFLLFFIKEQNKNQFLISISADNKQYLLVKKGEELKCYDLELFQKENKFIIIKDLAKTPSKPYKTFGNIDGILLLPIETFHITIAVDEYIAIDEKRYLPYLKASETFKRLLFESPVAIFKNKKKKIKDGDIDYNAIENGLALLRTHVDLSEVS
ncbi:hypothetical protein GINT2_000593 [Glugoides intestinalis]